MKIRFHKTFRIQVDARTLNEYKPGVQDVPDDVALKAIKFGFATKVVEKKAPENKVVKIAENKAKVGKKAKRRRSARSKPDE